MSNRLYPHILAAGALVLMTAPALAQETFPVRLRVSNQLGQSVEQAYTLTVTTPTHSEWVYMPESNVSGFTVPAFAVSKYEMSGTSPASPAAGQLSDTYSWASCRSACQAIGPGYDMIKESQWNRIAHDLLNQPANWSGAAIGSGKLFYGIASAAASSTDDANGYHNAPTAGYDQFNRRTMVTETGEVLWDIARGRLEWTYADDGRTGASSGIALLKGEGLQTYCNYSFPSTYTGQAGTTSGCAIDINSTPFPASNTDGKPGGSYTNANTNTGLKVQYTISSSYSEFQSNAYLQRGYQGLFGLYAHSQSTSAGCRCALNSPPAPEVPNHLQNP